jgi:hypothetical protein
MSERFLFTTIPLADEDKVEKLKDNLGRAPEDDEVDLSYGEIVIDLGEVEAVRQSFKDTQQVEGEAVVYLLGEPFFVQTSYDQVLRLWLDFKEYPQGKPKAPSDDVGQAVGVLARELERTKYDNEAEGSLYFGYQSNIAMSFVDAWVSYYGKTTDRPGDRKAIKEIANEAAKSFLDMLIGSIK